MTARRQSWQRVRDEVRRRIRSREWAPGAAIPHEAELAREFGCARATVNRALRDLAEAGVLDRRRRAGTRVAETPVRRAVLRIPVLREEIEGAGLTYGYRLIGREEVVDDGTPALRIAALHLGDGRPFVVEERLVSLAEAPAIRAAELERVSANEWLIRNAPFAGASLSISAVAAEGRLAERLDCAAGVPLVRLSRRTWSETGWITKAELSYAPGHRLESEM